MAESKMHKVAVNLGNKLLSCTVNCEKYEALGKLWVSFHRLPVITATTLWKQPSNGFESLL